MPLSPGCIDLDKLHDCSNSSVWTPSTGWVQTSTLIKIITTTIFMRRLTLKSVKVGSVFCRHILLILTLVFLLNKMAYLIFHSLSSLKSLFINYNISFKILLHEKVLTWNVKREKDKWQLNRNCQILRYLKHNNLLGNKRWRSVDSIKHCEKRLPLK